LWLILLVVWLLDPPGLGLETDLLEFLIVLLIVLGFLAGSVLVVVWEIEMVLEGPAEGWIQRVLRKLDPTRTTEVRLAIAGSLFLVGTVLLFVEAYR
jgi:hypothetical protein